MMAACADRTGAACGSVIGEAARRRRHLIFDLDGTLVDSCAVCVAILQDMLAERGSTRRIDPVVARPLMSQGGIRLVAGLLGPDCGDAQAEVAEFRARYLVVKTGAETVYAGVIAGLQRLAQAGFTMAVCSNKPQALCEKVLADTGLDAFFTAVAGGQPGRAPKPAPDLLTAVTGMLDRQGADCIFIGDSDLDSRVARDADLPFAFMTYGYADHGWHPHHAHDWHDAASECFGGFDALVDALLAGARVPA